MMRIYSPGPERAVCATMCDLQTLPENAVWIDMLEPTHEEEQFVERALGIMVPTRDEMVEIEPSSRLYRENGAIYATANVLAGLAENALTNTEVSFVLTPAHLVTVRYASPRAFETIKAHAERAPLLTADPGAVLLTLLDAIVDRLADILEHVGGDLDRISGSTFKRAKSNRNARMSTVALQVLLTRIGHAQDVVSKARDSALTLARVLGFLTFAMPQKDSREQLRSLARDVSALTDHANYLGQNITFLLDAVLGLISLEQANISKIFSVAALVFLPPTLIAGIYGMNFEILPELKWQFGYLWALGLMLASAVFPYLLFRWRGWL
ncbi:magnesium transporter CorA family protein [Glacieibacterium frigidum]|uniref:Magnesium transport protein CorA n=1 Tax=Glacieibacterium frigidum TaxID=2593303 RepID=A0A552U8R3_9SPHN|nr:magnesium transporter CorA family protein [Glacieibacterium frigidum]TRW14607.1 magnesium transporter [Glacieibacterium frigidum]